MFYFSEMPQGVDKFQATDWLLYTVEQSIFKYNFQVRDYTWAVSTIVQSGLKNLTRYCKQIPQNP